MTKIFIIAGESSGDLLGSKFMDAFKKQMPKIKFVGIGGERMEKQGLKSLFSMKEIALMGIFEILPKIFKLLRLIKLTIKEIKKQQPDLILTIDSPGFCFKVIKVFQNNKKIKKVHLIAPSVWAWKPKRAEKIAKLYDLLLCILPFEPPYFEKWGLATKFIGHPIFDGVLFDDKKNLIENDKVYNFPDCFGEKDISHNLQIHKIEGKYINEIDERVGELLARKEIIKTDSIEFNDFIDLSKREVVNKVFDYYYEKYGKIIISKNKQIKEVILEHKSITPIYLTKEGIKNSIQHTSIKIIEGKVFLNDRKQAIAFKYLDKIIENAIIISKELEWKGRKYDTYLLGSDLNIDNVEYIVEVIIKREKNKQLYFYIHNVIEKKKFREIYMRCMPASTGLDINLSKTIKSSIITLKQNVNNFKIHPIINGEIYTFLDCLGEKDKWHNIQTHQVEGKYINEIDERVEELLGQKEIEIRNETFNEMDITSLRKYLFNYYYEKYGKISAVRKNDNVEFKEIIFNHIELGNIKLTKKSIRTSISHNSKKILANKIFLNDKNIAISFKYLDQLLENGVIISKELNWKDRNYDTYLIGNNIKIDDKIYLVEIVIKSKDKILEFYIHNVILKEKFREIYKTFTDNNQPFFTNLPNLKSSIINFKQNVNNFKEQQLQKNNTLTLILTPGSRQGEVKRIYPIMLKVIEILKQKYTFKCYTFVTPNTKELVKQYKIESEIVVNEEQKKEILTQNKVFAIAKSGTNTFEFNIYGVPLVVVYTMNYLTNKLGKLLIKIKFANLVNIIANREIIPEFIGDKAKPELLADKVDELLQNDDKMNRQIRETQEIIKILGYNNNINASERGAEYIKTLLGVK